MTYITQLAVSAVRTTDLPRATAGSSTLSNVLGIVFAIAGALALLMIVISGLRYIFSGGDPQKAASARQGILYALVGLVIAIMAQTIVVFVVRRV